jgi:hypothetical protein
MSKKSISYVVIRGKVIDTDLVEFGGRGSDIDFLAPDPHKIVDQFPLGSPTKLDDLYQLTFDEILDYLEELGKHLDFSKNEYMQEACELSCATSPQTPPLVRGFYTAMPAMFDRRRIKRWLEASIPIPYLEGWVYTEIEGTVFAIRAYGARALHIIAGNGPALGALTLMRSAVTRSDTIIKVPSNDPFTTGAIARTMCDFAPDHPITKHFSVGYWKGGDEAFEKQLYQPHHIEKIIAWGGLASVRHVTQYIQPGLELISLDPKRSASVVGADALKSEALLRETARRIAADVGTLNQTACTSCRIVYVMSGTDEGGLEKLSRLGRMVYDGIMSLPGDISTKPKRYDPVLKAHVDALRLDDEWFEVIGGEEGEGAVIISHTAEAVDFVASLADRTVNLVPVDTLDEVLDAVDSYTQTVGVFPDDLMPILRHKMALWGGQRFVSLGYAFCGPGFIGPQDGMEPLRRMCKWIVCEGASKTLKPIWERREGESEFVA